jgi:hypothetical protein
MDTKLDMLITRVVDGVASPADWEALDVAGAADPSVWRELAHAQRAEHLLKGAAGEAVAVADHVELPAVIGRVGEAGLKHRIGRVATWGGWAAAALLTLAFIGRGTFNQGGQENANLVPSFASSGEAYRQYIDQGKKEGRVIAEIPDRVMMDASPTQDGKAYEVIFVRQIMERARVDNLSQVSYDEAGKPVLSRVQIVVAKGGV